MWTVDLNNEHSEIEIADNIPIPAAFNSSAALLYSDMHVHSITIRMELPRMSYILSQGHSLIFIYVSSFPDIIIYGTSTTEYSNILQSMMYA